MYLFPPDTLGVSLLCVIMNMTVVIEFNYKENRFCAVLGYYAAYTGKYLPIFRGNLLVPSSRVRGLGLYH